MDESEPPLWSRLLNDLKNENATLRKTIAELKQKIVRREGELPMKSYDIDGVISVGVRPERPCLIVSGRLAQFASETRTELAARKIGPDIAVYLRPAGEPGDRVGAAVWKALVINCGRVEEHWEDDPLQAQIIAAMCRVRIVMVKAGDHKAGPTA